jgi:hypothetical protein
MLDEEEFGKDIDETEEDEESDTDEEGERDFLGGTEDREESF